MLKFVDAVSSSLSLPSSDLQRRSFSLFLLFGFFPDRMGSTSQLSQWSSILTLVVFLSTSSVYYLHSIIMILLRWQNSSRSCCYFPNKDSHSTLCFFCGLPAAFVFEGRPSWAKTISEETICASQLFNGTPDFSSTTSGNKMSRQYGYSKRDLRGRWGETN